MKIYNKSPREQSIRITDRYGHMYTIYLPGFRTTELDPCQISSDVVSLVNKGVLQCVEGELPYDTKDKAPLENIAPQQDSATLNHIELNDPQSNPTNLDENVVDPEKSVEETSSLFVCPSCGNEFASQRGLTMHINKSHPELLK